MLNTCVIKKPEAFDLRLCLRCWGKLVDQLLALCGKSYTSSSISLVQHALILIGIVAGIVIVCWHTA